MNWFLVLVAFSLAVFVGASAASLFARVRPGWSERRRLVAAALVLPAVTVAAAVATVAAVLLNGEVQGGDMRDLAIAAIAAIGGGVALLALLGGLVGAWLRQRGARR